MANDTLIRGGKDTMETLFNLAEITEWNKFLFDTLGVFSRYLFQTPIGLGLGFNYPLT